MNEKLEAMLLLLGEKHIEHWTDVQHPTDKDIIIPLYIPRYNIAVFDGHSETWFQAIRRFAFPVFIRDEETTAFVIKKLKNTMFSPKGRLDFTKTRWFKKNVKEAHKHLRGKNRRRKNRTTVKDS